MCESEESLMEPFTQFSHRSLQGVSGLWTDDEEVDQDRDDEGVEHADSSSDGEVSSSSCTGLSCDVVGASIQTEPKTHLSHRKGDPEEVGTSMDKRAL